MMNKLISFCKDVYSPGTHLYFAANWFVALQLGLLTNHSKKFAIVSYWPVAVVTLFLVLFYLRAIDEIKDLDYDQIHNPDRPLVKGSINLKGLLVYCLISGSISLLLNLPFGPWPVSVVLIDIIYGAILIGLEKKANLIKDNMLLNLVFTYPVNIMLSFYILALNLSSWQEYASTRDILLIFSFTTAFLYYEFTRKISWPHQELQGQRTYSSALGTLSSLILTVAVAIITIGLLTTLYQSMVPVILVVPVIWGLIKFLKAKRTNKGLPMNLSGPIFIGLFYGIVIVINLRELGLL